MYVVTLIRPTSEQFIGQYETEQLANAVADKIRKHSVTGFKVRISQCEANEAIRVTKKFDAGKWLK